MPLTHSFTHRSYHSIQFIHAIIINDRGPKKRTSSTGNSQQTIIIRSGGRTDGRTDIIINKPRIRQPTHVLFVHVHTGRNAGRTYTHNHNNTQHTAHGQPVCQLGSHLAAKPTLAPNMPVKIYTFKL